MMIKAAILDDEVRGSSLLQHKLKGFLEEVSIEAVFNDPLQALREIRRYSIDVLFLDIEMPVLNGFEFLEQLEQFEFEVVFVTAYNIYTLEALRIQALDYLMKPVDIEELKKALEKVKHRIVAKQKMINTVADPARYSLSRIALPTAEGIHLVKKDEILRVEAMSNYSVFYLNNSSKIIVSRTLKEFEAVFSEPNFLRVNRSVIVNLDYVVKYRKGDGGTLEMVDGTEVEVSPAKKIQLMERLFST